MKAHPLARTTRYCLAHDRVFAQYDVDFGGGKLFPICGDCFAAVFGQPTTAALAHLSNRSTTAEARDAFRSWMEHLGAVDAAKRLGGTYT